MPVSLVDPYAAGIVWDEVVDSDSVHVDFLAPTSKRKWLVTGSADPNDILATQAANVPLVNVRGGITHFFKDGQLDPTSPTLGNTWTFTADYAFAVDSFELSFDTSGGTAKREQAFDVGDYYSCRSPGGQVTPGSPLTLTTADFDIAITYARGDYAKSGGIIYSSLADANLGNAPPDATWWAVPNPPTVPNFKGIVIDGVEVPDEKFDFTVLIRNKISTLSATYVDMLSKLTGHANSLPLTLTYKGQSLTFGPEELLYLGMPGKVTSEDGYEFTLKFSKQASKFGGSVITAEPPGTVTYSVALSGSVTIGIADPAAFKFPGGSSIITAEPPGTVTYSVALSGSVTIGVQSAAIFTPLIGLKIYIDGNAYLVTATALAPDTVTLTALGPSAGPFVIKVGGYLSADLNPLVIGQSGPIAKLGWRYLKVINKEVLYGVQRIPEPQYVIVNKVIPTADLSVIGIFT